MNVPVVGEGDGTLERREPGCVRFILLVCISCMLCTAVWTEMIERRIHIPTDTVKERKHNTMRGYSTRQVSFINPCERLGVGIFVLAAVRLGSTCAG